MEMTEKWKDPGFTTFFIVVAITMIASKINLFKFIAFLSLNNLYFLLFHFPEVANHVNLVIFTNFTLIATAIYGWIRYPRQVSAEFYFNLIRPILQIFTILIYTIAGFHKFNTDFFNPNVSCTGGMLFAIYDMLKTNILFIPTALIICAGIFFILWKLTILKKFINFVSGIRWNFLKITALSVATIILITTSIIALLTLPGQVKAVIVLSNAVVVVAWELVGGIFLLIPQLQGPMILYSWIMHSVLALIGFVDFGSLILPFLIMFIPDNYYQLLGDSLTLPNKVKVKRIYLYIYLTLLLGFLSLINHHFLPINNWKTIAGILFNLAAIILLFPILQERFSKSQPMQWQGVPIIISKSSNMLLIFPIVLFLFGMTSYFGLRTAGNFSMFSNLKTEGEGSNHLLLRNNPLKIWNYQEDSVYFLEIDDKKYKTGHQYRTLKGHSLPVVEFKKLILKWKKVGYEVPMTFEYKGQIYITNNIVNDPTWKTDKTNWKMYFMDFRIIQKESPNSCRW
ncbi:hypothetical protein [Crocosphaera sp.]|uniref:hypothetical protein n=1 Tax=Crocosphaera sp. TaxID=2729996 RepID=UPI003F282FB3